MIWRAVFTLFGFLKSWIGALLAIAAALYYGPRKMLETWDWYVYRFIDSAVFEMIDEPRVNSTVYHGREYVNVPAFLKAYSVREIAKALNRTEKSVVRSLKRLKKSKKAAVSKYGWLSSQQRSLENLPR
jgi:hypothetical protein